MFASVALILFPVLMVFAALADLFTMTIPNRVSLLLVAFYFALALYLRQPWELVAMNASCGVAMLLITFTMFSFRWIGGGDAKLAAATALWLGWGALFEYGVIASLIGGALTVAIMALRFSERLPPQLLSYEFMRRLADKSGGVPYGIALALAGLLIYPHTSVWMGLTAG
ncbi:MAG TPA: prepilin peptidase [Methylocystis sp.]|nr:prepilin peptidase [Methylocystis sp.]